MKNTLKLITALGMIIATSGCSSTNITKLATALAKDQAVVSMNVSSVYGTVKFVRIGGSTNSVTVNPDGTVTVNK